MAADVGESCHAPFAPWMLSLSALSVLIAASICSTFAPLEPKGVCGSLDALVSFIASQAEDEEIGAAVFDFHHIGAHEYLLAESMGGREAFKSAGRAFKLGEIILTTLDLPIIS